MAGHATRPVTVAAVLIAVAALREGLTSDAAGARAGMTGRALRKHLAKAGLRELDLRPPPARPEPPAVDREERRRRLRAQATERRWERQRERTAAVAYSRQAEPRRRDLHILLTAAAWEAVHAEAERRRCSLSSLIADVLHEAGITPEA